jgi:hypothetical protein
MLVIINVLFNNIETTNDIFCIPRMLKKNEKVPGAVQQTFYGF